VKEAQETLG